ncbi:MAG TPA: universal stress protein [Desulfotomaculum sp.]|nr:universal stress protein [Desulfotomaculum sp.]
MFKKILVPVDGSEASRLAVRTAARMAEKFGAEVMLFHVMQLPSPTEMFETFSGKLGEIYYQVKDRIARFGSRVLEDALKDCEGFKVIFKEKAVWGEPAREIIQEAAEGRYDLVVMGSRGWDDVDEWLLGSISQRVVRRCKCPVLVVR